MPAATTVEKVAQRVIHVEADRKKDILLDLIAPRSVSRRHRLHPHQARRRQAGEVPRRRRRQCRRDPRRQEPGPARAGAGVVQERPRQGADRHRHRRPRHRRRCGQPRVQLRIAERAGSLRPPHRPHRPRRGRGHRHHPVRPRRARLLRDIEKLTRLTLPSEDLRLDRSTPTTRAERAGRARRRSRGAAVAAALGAAMARTARRRMGARASVRLTIRWAPHRVRTPRAAVVVKAAAAGRADGPIAAGARPGRQSNRRSVIAGVSPGYPRTPSGPWPRLGAATPRSASMDRRDVARR